MNKNVIQHGGPGSGRYPLGSGNRPYQKFEGTRKKISGVKNYIKNKKKEKEIKEANKKKEKESLIKKMHEANKEKVLRKGTAKEVMEYQGELTNQQLQEAFTRLNLEANIRRLSENEKTKNVKKVDNVMKNIKTGNEWVDIGTKAYNNLASIYNATEEGRRNPMVIIKK